jgi:hypothetical protein
MLMMAYNMFRTIANGKIAAVPVLVPAKHHA